MITESEETPGRIKIIKTPDGEAPEEIRKAWVGLILPCHPICGLLGGSEMGLLSQEKLSKKRRVFTVPQTEAIAILEKTNPKVANWWRENGFPHAGNFCFGEDEAEIMSGVEMQRIVHVPEEAMGNLDR